MSTYTCVLVLMALWVDCKLTFPFKNTPTHSCVSGLERADRQSACREIGSFIQTWLKRQRLPLGFLLKDSLSALWCPETPPPERHILHYLHRCQAQKKKLDYAMLSSWPVTVLVVYIAVTCIYISGEVYIEAMLSGIKPSASIMFTKTLVQRCHKARWVLFFLW